MNMTEALATMRAIAKNPRDPNYRKARALVAAADEPDEDKPKTAKELATQLRAIRDDEDADPELRKAARLALEALDEDDDPAPGTSNARGARAAMTPDQQRAYDAARVESEVRARLSPQERELLAKTEPRRVQGQGSAQRQGTMLVMPVHMTREQAAARVAELAKELGK